MSLFQYTYTDGTTVTGDTLREPERIFELIFLRDPARFEADGVRRHLGHPLHEAAMTALPPNLGVLRAIKTRIRQWPVLPLTIQECYLSTNHYLSVPDLSAYTNLIVLELDDNSIATIDKPLPPNLARLNLDINALR